MAGKEKGKLHIHINLGTLVFLVIGRPAGCSVVWRAGYAAVLSEQHCVGSAGQGHRIHR